MIKHWNTTATKDGKPVNLYVSTTEGTVKLDLSAGAGSLIDYARRGHFPNFPKDDHRDLAISAFGYHCDSRKATWSDQTLRTCDSIPPGLESFWYGGAPGGNTVAVSVHEEPCA